MVTADLEKPPNVECARKVYDGVSLRTLRAYVPGTDQTVNPCRRAVRLPLRAARVGRPI
jgi:hypothetical protein